MSEKIRTGIDVENALAKIERVSTFRGVDNLNRQLESLAQLTGNERIKKSAEFGQKRREIRTRLLEKAKPYLELIRDDPAKLNGQSLSVDLPPKPSEPQGPPAVEKQFNTQESSIIANLISTKVGIRILKHGQELFTFELPQKYEELCRHIIEKSLNGVRLSPQQLEQLRTITISRLCSIIENGNIEHVEGQNEQLSELLAWLSTEVQDKFEGDLPRFLTEEPRRSAPIDLGGGTVRPGKRFWELPNGYTQTPNTISQAEPSTLTLEEVVNHPLYISPITEIEAAQFTDEPAALPGTELKEHQIKKYPEIGTFLETMPEATKDLLEKFLDSDQANWLLGKTNEAIVRFKSNEFNETNSAEFRDFRSRLVGAIFEELGYYHLAQKYNSQQGTFLLSPKEVRSLYEAIYPDKSINLQEAELLGGIDGITFPDGLVLKDIGASLLIDTVVDYKMWAKAIPSRKKFESQLENYNWNNLVRDFRRDNVLTDPLFHARILSGFRPEIPLKPLILSRNFSLVYPVPENSMVKFPTEILKEHVPINSTDFAHFIDIFIRIAEEKGQVSVPQQEEKIDSIEKIGDLVEEHLTSFEKAIEEITSAEQLQLEAEVEVEEISVSEEPTPDAMAGSSQVESSTPPVVELAPEKVQKHPLESRDEKILETISQYTSDAINLLSPTASINQVTKAFSNLTLTVIRRAINNGYINPSNKNSDGHETYTRAEVVSTRYMLAFGRHKGFGSRQRKQLEQLIIQTLEHKEEEKKESEKQSQTSVK